LGRVTDSSNAVIVGAKVEALNTATGVRISATTNESGDYFIPYLIPGPYTIAVAAQGFKNYMRSGIVVRINDRIAIDVALELGAQTQTVEVTGQTPLLDTST